MEEDELVSEHEEEEEKVSLLLSVSLANLN